MTSDTIGRDEAPGQQSPTSGPRSSEAWLTAILSALHEGVLVFDPDGLVLEMNQAFTDLFGYDMSDGPIVPPYPWWPTEAEDPEQLALIKERHARARSGIEDVAEYRFYDRDRTPVWVSSADAPIREPGTGLIAVVRSYRNITRQKEAQTRRAAATRLSADLAGADDLASLLSIAQHGFETLFDGGSTTQLEVGRQYLFGAEGALTPDELGGGARTGLAGSISADATTPRPGILLVPRTSTTGCRAWVQFRRPRPIGPDEMIVADLLAQAFGLAVDRLVTTQLAADREANLRQAIESHRTIGQAVGILVERHRLPPGEAFDRIRQASQNRNLKLRDLAARIVETGTDPTEA